MSDPVEQLIERLRDVEYRFTNAVCNDLRIEAADALARLKIRIDGYQASRDYAIDVLANALSVEPDKIRAVEYYVTQASELIARQREEIADARSDVARLHKNKMGLLDANISLRRENEGLRADAERWRNLRRRVSGFANSMSGSRENGEWRMTTPDTTPEALQDFCAALKRKPDALRKGQFAMNLLSARRPDLYDRLMQEDRELDPFYSDDRLPAFFDWLRENWNG